MYDHLIVGAGFAGAVVAERLAGTGKKVLLVEKRGHVGGNCYDFQDPAGILVHKYGPHIFHTNNKEVWDYLSGFTKWLPYRHRVLANADGQTLTLPPNLDTIHELFEEPKAALFEQKLVAAFGAGKRVPVLELRKSKDPDLRELADAVYEKIYLNYTRKQWGVSPDELDPQVTERVPLWTDRDDRYFKDKYQGIPDGGYTRLTEKMLDRSGIEVVLNKDYEEIKDRHDFQRLIYTGPIDRFFNYKHGRLPYRSLRFEFETLGQERFQEAAVVNYTGKEPFTRITEFKHFSGQSDPRTTILREYPEDHVPDENVPCYPVPRKENFDRYQKYKSEADKLGKSVFLGRLAEYRYYNMDEVVGRALAISSQILKTT